MIDMSIDRLGNSMGSIQMVLKRLLVAIAGDRVSETCRFTNFVLADSTCMSLCYKLITVRIVVFDMASDSLFFFYLALSLTLNSCLGNRG